MKEVTLNEYCPNIEYYSRILPDGSPDPLDTTTGEQSQTINSLLSIDRNMRWTVILFVILLSIISQACSKQNPGNGRDARATSMSKNELKSYSIYECLDTTKLNLLGIEYSHFESKPGREEWRLISRDTVAKSEQINELIYFASGHTEHQNCHPIFQLDSFLIRLNANNQVVLVAEFGCYFHSYESLANPDIIFKDFNFDNIIDIGLISGASGNSNEIREYYIYNRKSNKFNPSIKMVNASFDTRKKLIHQEWSDGHAGKTGGTTTYRFSEADTLVMIKSENRNYLQEIDSYVKEIILLRDDGSYSRTIDTIRRE